MKLFKKKDPICGMKEENGKGTHKHGKWFCSSNCIEKHEKTQTTKPKGNCCGNC